MKKILRNLRGKAILVSAVVIAMLTTAATVADNYYPYLWEELIQKAERKFIKVLSRQIVEKTLDDFLAGEPAELSLQKLNYIARENFFQTYSPWQSDKNDYQSYASAIFFEWGGKEPLNNQNEAYDFLKRTGALDLAWPFLYFRNNMMGLGKKYLAKDENLKALYRDYKPLLIEKFRGREYLLAHGIDQLTKYIKTGKGLSDYDMKYLDRRKKEGGIEIIEAYRWILIDLKQDIKYKMR